MPRASANTTRHNTLSRIPPVIDASFPEKWYEMLQDVTDFKKLLLSPDSSFSARGNALRRAPEARGKAVVTRPEFPTASPPLPEMIYKNAEPVS